MSIWSSSKRNRIKTSVLEKVKLAMVEERLGSDRYVYLLTVSGFSDQSNYRFHQSETGFKIILLQFSKC